MLEDDRGSDASSINDNEKYCHKEKQKIFHKLFSQTGVDLFSDQRVAS